MHNAKKPMIFHLNTGKRVAARLRLTENLKDINDAIVSINETDVKISNIETFYPPLYSAMSNRRTRAAVYIKGDVYKGILIADLSTPDVAVVNVTGMGADFVIISAYLPPSGEYERALHELDRAVKELTNRRIIICSDTNSRSTFWNDRENNNRGSEFESFIASNDLRIINLDGPPTYSDIKGTSTIDLILANDLTLDYWPVAEVMSCVTGSDHRMINVELELRPTKNDAPFRNTTRKYRTNKANWEMFGENLNIFEHIIKETNFDATDKEEADLAVESLNEYLATVCESSIPKLKHANRRMENENDEIEKLTKLEENLNSRYNKLVKKNRFQAIIVLKELKEATNLKTVAKLKHRNECMEKKFININTTNDLNEAYKIHKTFKAKVNRSCPTTIEDLEGNKTRNSHETTEKLFNYCFPNKEHPKLQGKISIMDHRLPIKITEAEVSSSINWMANNKAPGVDGFTPEIIKKALHKILEPITKLYNALMNIGYFPDAWKEGFAIFIPKGNSSNRTKTLKDFRPITLLTVLAKNFERLLIGRINKFLLTNNKLNRRQDGFSKQRSTIHSLHSLRNFIMHSASENRSTVAVFLDISGAFDNACWQLIVEALSNKECPTYLINLIISYFQNRKVVTNSHNSKLEKNLTQGAPQGSCCGPSLWNILLDSLFDIEQVRSKLNLKNFYIKAFADDICLAFAVDNEIKNQKQISKFEKEIEETLNAIYSWGKAHYLDFNIEKTNAMLFKSSAYVKVPKISMNNQVIKLKNTVKYLGIWFDEAFSFKDHALKTIDKCQKVFNIVRSYCGRTWGLNSYLTRLIYKTIIVPVLTYGASIWYPALMHGKVSKKIRTLQYYCTKSIAKSYRTASIAATSLMSNTLPLEPEVFMRAQIELSRITGAIQSDIFRGTLVSSKSYKPQYYYGSLMGSYKNEENLISIQDPTTFEFGNPDKLKVEPAIYWADLAVGQDKAPTEICYNIKKVRAEHDYYIFTDGSSIRDHGTGGSFVIKTKPEKVNVVESQVLPMHPLCTVFQSEMFAIYKGLNWVDQNLDLVDKKLLICTDSLSALQKLKRNCDDNLLSYLINDSLAKIASKKGVVSFVKVSAHQDERLTEIDNNSIEAFLIQGNIDADHLAREASKLSSELNATPLYSFISLNTVKRHINSQLKGAWLDNFFDPNFQDDRAPLNEWIKNFIPSPNYAGKKLLTLCDYYTTQIVIGHGGFKSYFKRFKIADDDLCIICKDQPDSPEHILFKCKEGKYKRTLTKMGICKPKDLCKILKSDENIAGFKKLCKLIIMERRELLNSSSELESTKGETASSSKLKLKSKSTEPKTCEKKEPAVKIGQASQKTTKFETNIKNRSSSQIATAEQKDGQEKKIKSKNRFNVSKRRDDSDTNARWDVSVKHRISSTSWLTDKHIEDFIAKNQAETGKLSHLLIPFIFYQNFRHLANFLGNYLKADTENILVIIHYNSNHWILGAINLKEKLIAIFDSIGTNRHERTFKKLYLVAEMAMYGQGRSCSINEFKLLIAPDNPQQHNGNDCGLFVCRTARSIFVEDASVFEIRTGEFRKELVQSLESETLVIEPSHGNILNQPKDRLQNQNFSDATDVGCATINRLNFSDLIRAFF